MTIIWLNYLIYLYIYINVLSDPSSAYLFKDFNHVYHKWVFKNILKLFLSTDIFTFKFDPGSWIIILHLELRRILQAGMTTFNCVFHQIYFMSSRQLPFQEVECTVYTHTHSNTHTHFEKHSLPSTQFANTCIITSEKCSIASQKEYMPYFLQISCITWSSRNSFFKHFKAAVYVKTIQLSTHSFFPEGCRIAYNKHPSQRVEFFQWSAVLFWRKHLFFNQMQFCWKQIFFSNKHI